MQKESTNIELRNDDRTTDIIFYADKSGNKKIEVLFENETFWLSQKRIAGGKFNYSKNSNSSNRRSKASFESSR